MATPFQITIDCVDAEVMTRFWSLALGYVEEPPPPGSASWEEFLQANDIPVPSAGSVGAIVDPDGVAPRVLFLRVPETKTVKNRMHLDVRAGRGDDVRKQAKVDELVAAGASQVRRVDEEGGWWMVMTDPEGNEFCVT